MTTLPPTRRAPRARPRRRRCRCGSASAASTSREALLLEGPSGWGEFSPFVEYADAEAARWLAAGLEAAYAVWPAPVRDAVPVNATVPAVGPERVPEVLARFDGCTTAKVKVAERGQTLDDDVDRVAAVRSAMGPVGARSGSTPTAAGTSTTATEALRRLTAYDLEYAEQPCATVEELVELRTALARNGIDVPIAADESIRKAEDPIRVARLGAADIVVVKVAPLGGVGAALEIVEACGLPAVVSSALDTSVGIAAGVALAAALPVARPRVRARHGRPLRAGRRRPRRGARRAVCWRPGARCPTRRRSPPWRPRPTGSSGGATGSSAATPCSPADGRPRQR